MTNMSVLRQRSNAAAFGRVVASAAAASSSSSSSSVYYEDELIAAIKPSVVRDLSFDSIFDPSDFADLALGFVEALRLPGTSTHDSVGNWFRTDFPLGVLPDGTPEENELLVHILNNLLQYLVYLGDLLQPMLKVSRAALAAKLLVHLLLGYADIISDGLVSKVYYSTGWMGFFQLSVVLMAGSLVVQTVYVYLQYRGRGRSAWVPRVLLTAIGLGPTIETVNSFRVQSKELEQGFMVKPQIVLAVLRVIEVSFESLGQGVCQSIAFVAMDHEGGPSGLIAFSIILSFFSIAFAMTEASVAVGQSVSRDYPGEPLNLWLPVGNHDPPSRYAKFYIGMLLFNASYSFLFVMTMTVLYFYLESATDIGVIIGVEYITLYCFKLYNDEVALFTSKYSSRFADRAVGILMVWASYLATSSCPFVACINPGMLGHLFPCLIIYRYVTTAVVMSLVIPALPQKIWLSASLLTSIYLSALSLSLIGLLLVWTNFRLGFNKSLMFKIVRRTSHFEKNASLERIGFIHTLAQKQERESGYDKVFLDRCERLHPSCFTADGFVEFVVDLAERFGPGGISKSSDVGDRETPFILTFNVCTAERLRRLEENFAYYRMGEEGSKRFAEAVRKLKARYSSSTQWTQHGSVTSSRKMRATIRQHQFSIEELRSSVVQAGGQKIDSESRSSRSRTREVSVKRQAVAPAPAEPV